ncbi:MAG: diaminopimelate epimerase, partial [Allisonella histaminiformans]
MHFTKWNGCGNDFVFINAMHMDDLKPVLDKCERICDRHFGIGADGIIFVLPSQKADLRMRIFNADGSEAEMCGNGIRCFARWAYELGLVSTRRFSVETGAGILYPEILDDHRVRVDMGAPHLEAAVVPTTGFSGNPVVSEELVSSTGSHYKVTCVSMG